jgi:AMMECR1 domain-containing protein
VAPEQGWDKEETLMALMRKAGWSGKREEWRKVGVKVTRYQGEKVAVEYDEWRAWREWVDVDGEEEEEGEGEK